MSKRSLCTGCKVPTLVTTHDMLSIRLSQGLNSLEGEISSLFSGEETEEVYYVVTVIRLQSVTTLKLRGFLMFTLNKKEQAVPSTGFKISTKVKISEIDKQMECSSELNGDGELLLHATIHHLGIYHNSGHYIIRFYDLVNVQP